MFFLLLLFSIYYINSKIKNLHQFFCFINIFFYSPYNIFDKIIYNYLFSLKKKKIKAGRLSIVKNPLDQISNKLTNATSS